MAKLSLVVFILFFNSIAFAVMPPYPPDRFGGSLIIDGKYIGEVRCIELRQPKFGEHNSLNCDSFIPNKELMETKKVFIDITNGIIKHLDEIQKDIDEFYKKLSK